MFFRPVFVAFLFTLLLPTLALAAPAASSMLACASKTGVISIRSKCSKGETRVGLNNLVSSFGVSGESGPVGPQGSKGEAGSTGPTGNQGAKGETGVTGPTGIQGTSGFVKFNTCYTRQSSISAGSNGRRELSVQCLNTDSQFILSRSYNLQGVDAYPIEESFIADSKGIPVGILMLTQSFFSTAQYTLSISVTCCDR